MPVDFLSDEQVARYRRFRREVSVAEIEQFFRLDAKALEALEALAGKRVMGHDGHANESPVSSAELSGLP